MLGLTAIYKPPAVCFEKDIQAQEKAFALKAILSEILDLGYTTPGGSPQNRLPKS